MVARKLEGQVGDSLAILTDWILLIVFSRVGEFCPIRLRLVNFVMFDVV